MIKLIVDHDELYNLVKGDFGKMGIDTDQMAKLKGWAKKNAMYIAKATAENDDERNNDALMQKRAKTVMDICGFNQISMENINFKGKMMGGLIIFALLAPSLQGVLSSDKEEEIAQGGGREGR
ncbi:hypothetical protein A2153_02840 [Candidatus Gottesmanbacteria bacterium RBG_16_38_7b]|uniref:Uncharacterized protein n=1 Tax=Candidatus Gottesmanbacteria bacterium RBG_16_38_7b TaxID=1798372 RepID=A0A1F5YFM4_9BACT|nr:MAG: hypothetical protein A2153_02840 [Candidatus Gottesmanbacteria bacterium RBG_16_38_7b]